MGSSPAIERQQQLEEIERHISAALTSAGQAMQEISKDKPSVKQMEGHSSSFMKSIEKIESGLYKQIEYLTQVSTSQPHEGSCYAAQKDLQMARHRLEHVKSRINELERMRSEHRHRQQLLLHRQLSGGDHLSNMQRAYAVPTDQPQQQSSTPPQIRNYPQPSPTSMDYQSSQPTS